MILDFFCLHCRWTAFGIYFGCIMVWAVWMRRYVSFFIFMQLPFIICIVIISLLFIYRPLGEKSHHLESYREWDAMTKGNPE
jgi:hypothetical protein